MILHIFIQINRGEGIEHTKVEYFNWSRNQLHFDYLLEALSSPSHHLDTYLWPSINVYIYCFYVHSISFVDFRFNKFAHFVFSSVKTLLTLNCFMDYDAATQQHLVTYLYMVQYIASDVFLWRVCIMPCILTWSSFSLFGILFYFPWFILSSINVIKRNYVIHIHKMKRNWEKMLANQRNFVSKNDWNS